jgi:hypothetical protein
MLERRGDLRLGGETPAQFRVFAGFPPADFQRDSSIEFAVVRAVNGSHRTAADRFSQDIASERVGRIVEVAHLATEAG